MKSLMAKIFWFLVAVAAAWAYVTLFLHTDQPVNSAYILIAAICTYAIGFRFYSKWIAARVLALNDRRATPCEVHDDGKDFCKTNKWIVFGHHFAAISGPGPLVGPVLAAQFGYLPGTIWILIGAVLGGAVQDFVILFASIRRGGKSLGQMVKEELNTPAGYIALAAILSIVVILLAVLALVVVNALAESPWGIFTVGATIPIAMFMGGYLRFWRIGKVLEASVIGIVLLLLAVWGGQLVHSHAAWAHRFTFGAEPIAWTIVIYGFAASILPIWLLLAPRDYLSTFVKLGTIGILALGIFLVLPRLQMQALTPFVTSGEGLVFAGKLFPFCFITIACGAISGFHSLISSGTTPKIIGRETHSRPIGYGAMCLESFVAIMALIAACTLEPGVYFSMNMKGDPAATAAKVTAMQYPVTVQRMNDLASQIGEKTLFGRVGGAPTLAVGMANIFSRVFSGNGLGLWYHFAIMFEALFILTTLDAGTRVGRYLLQDFLGHVWKPLGNTKSFGANLLASGLMVAAWGCFLIQGVRDPLGGINSLWPLFGIANQMLAAIALCLAVTVILKMQLTTNESNVLPSPSGSGAISGPTPKVGKPVLALVAFVPLAWLLIVTLTAGVQKIWSSNPAIGFLAQARATEQQILNLEMSDAQAMHDLILGQNGRGGNGLSDAAVKKIDSDPTRAAVAKLRTVRFNCQLDAVVAGTFLVLITAIFAMSVREWILLLARKKAAALQETPPVWLPDYAVAKAKPMNVTALVALAFALAKELSGEAEMDRARAHHACACEQKTDAKIYAQITEERFKGVRRCC
ncbi:MAG TPA: carbon starvation CstA family protein [Verrucomicrobiae bacterium]|nr:carbon starvation CstA family protein [Verrucomicrobiae bacterium]